MKEEANSSEGGAKRCKRRVEGNQKKIRLKDISELMTKMQANEFEYVIVPVREKCGINFSVE